MAISVELRPVLENGVRDDAPTTAFPMNLSAVGVFGATDLNRVLYLFDLNQLKIPSGSTIESVRLNLVSFSGAGPNTQEPFAVYRVTQPWTRDATWNTYDGSNGWATAGGDFDTSISDLTGSGLISTDFVATNMANLYHDAINNRAGLMDIIVLAVDESTTFDGSPPAQYGPMSGTTTKSPTLTVTFTPPAQEQLLSLQVTEDVYIDESDPDSNFESTELKIGKPTSGAARRTLLRFNLSTLPKDTDLISGRLIIDHTTFGGSPAGEPVSVHRLSRSDWVASEVTWNNYKTGTTWISPGGDFGTTSDTSAEIINHLDFVATDMLPLVREARSGGTDLSLLVKQSDETQDYAGAPASYTDLDNTLSITSPFFATLEVIYESAITGLQASLGGIQNYSDSIMASSPSFFEPGHNILFPLEFTVSRADVVYILVRQRRNALGTRFATVLDPDGFTVTVQDSTTGNNLEFVLSVNDLIDAWNVNGDVPLVLRIDLGMTDDKTSPADYHIRSIDVFIKDNATKDFLSFRVTLSDDSQPFAFMHIKYGEIAGRHKLSNLATSALVTLSPKGSYLLLSPLATFQEVAAKDADFSFPHGSIHYKRRRMFNNETYNFSISAVSHEELRDVMSIQHVSGYPHVGVLRLDANLKEVASALSGGLYVDIRADARETDNSDTFRLYMSRTASKVIQSL